VPRDCMGEVIGDLNSRRARITGQDQRGDTEVLNALVPLSNMFGYAGSLASLSRRRATFAMQFSHYDRVPPRHDDDDPPFRPAIGMRG
jgi:elongation factor G